ncbi:MAG: hypothetical protein ACLP1Y_04330 [Candidatus Acidiferrales bacterium]
MFEVFKPESLANSCTSSLLFHTRVFPRASVVADLPPYNPLVFITEHPAKDASPERAPHGASRRISLQKSRYNSFCFNDLQKSAHLVENRGFLVTFNLFVFNHLCTLLSLFSCKSFVCLTYAKQPGGVCTPANSKSKVLLEISLPGQHNRFAVNHLQNRFPRDSGSVLAATAPTLTARQTQRRGGTGGDKLRPYQEKAELARLGGRALQVDARARFNNNG